MECEICGSTGECTLDWCWAAGERTRSMASVTLTITEGDLVLRKRGRGPIGEVVVEFECDGRDNVIVD